MDAQPGAASLAPSRLATTAETGGGRCKTRLRTNLGSALALLPRLPLEGDRVALVGLEALLLLEPSAGRPSRDLDELVVPVHARFVYGSSAGRYARVGEDGSGRDDGRAGGWGRGQLLPRHALERVWDHDSSVNELDSREGASPRHADLTLNG